MKNFFLLASILLSLGAQAQKGSYRDPSLDFQTRAWDLIAQMTPEEKISQLIDEAQAVERLGIPRYGWWNEALHGVARNGRATIFPQAIALAATFDPALVGQVASAISDEARAKYNAAQSIGNQGRYAGLTFWSPNINIFRDPRWGRGQETYGEDPYLTARMGVAFVRGMQGDDPRYLKTAACAKHYAVHSGPEKLRHEFDVNPSKKDLWETYLPAFEALVREAKVEAVMGAYNRVYGQSASGSEFLLRDILRRKWGFTGHVVSDCDAVGDIWSKHKIAATAAEASAIAIRAGLDLNCGTTYRALREALARGLVTERDIDNALFPLLMTRFKLGMFDPAEGNPYASIPESAVCSDANAALARKAAVESIVLLQNKGGALPLKKDLMRLIVAGPYGADAYVLMGNYYGISDRMSTYLEGIASKVSAGSTVEFRLGATPLTPKIRGLGNPPADVPVVVVIGNSSVTEEEGSDRQTLALPAHHIELLTRLRKNRTAPLITVVTGGSPIDMRAISELSDAVLMVWFGGQEGGMALADVLFGDQAPSGRLPVTFPVSEEVLPAYEDYSMQGRTYKYMADGIMYPFGYGLTYTAFEYSGLKVTGTPAAGKELTAEVTVRNSGACQGCEAVQFYVSAPGAGVTTPISSLVAFERVALQPGETRTLRVAIPAGRLHSVGDDGEARLLKGAYKLTASGAAPGKRTAQLGVPQAEAGFVVK